MIQKNKLIMYMNDSNLTEWIGGLSTFKTINDKIIKKCNNILTSKDKTHNDYTKCKNMFKSILTSFEPVFDYERWSAPIVEGSHNCYVYFLDDIVTYTFEQCEQICKRNNNCNEKNSECARLKPQPGKHAFYNNLRNDINRTFTCKSMIKGILDDNPSIKVLNENNLSDNFKKKCPKGYYKGALVIEKNKTYHFYRQDRDGSWSHKPGTLPITKKDADGNDIYVPHLAGMNYNKLKNGGINYDTFCNYLCVPANNVYDTKAR